MFQTVHASSYYVNIEAYTFRVIGAISVTPAAAKCNRGLLSGGLANQMNIN